jgi:predicted transcriptional regulator of viral defense system
MTKSEENLLKLLDGLEIDVFTKESLQKDYDMHLKEWSQPFRGLINKNYFDIIEKGKYCRHNFRNEYVIGNYLAPNGAVAYWSALNLHSLTEQISNTVFVQTPKLKRDKIVFGVRYQFIKVKPEKITGIETTGHGNHSYKITDKEKTIIDCFDLPQYGGEFPGIIRAFVTNEWNEQKLIEYAAKVNNIAAIKRMGYLAELFELPLRNFIEFAKEKVTKTISLFDNASEDKGTYITGWGLRMNINSDDILKMESY